MCLINIYCYLEKEKIQNSMNLSNNNKFIALLNTDRSITIYATILKSN